MEVRKAPPTIESLFDDIEKLRQEYQGKNFQKREKNLFGEIEVKPVSKDDPLDVAITNLSNYLYSLRETKDMKPELFAEEGVKALDERLKKDISAINREIETLKQQRQDKNDKEKEDKQIGDNLKELEERYLAYREVTEKFAENLFISNEKIDVMRARNLENNIKEFRTAASKKPRPEKIKIKEGDSEKEYTLLEASKLLHKELEQFQDQLGKMNSNALDKIKRLRTVSPPKNQDITTDHVDRLLYDLRSKGVSFNRSFPQKHSDETDQIRADKRKVDDNLLALTEAVRTNQKQVKLEGQAAAVDIKVAYETLNKQVAELTKQMNEALTRPKAITAQDIATLQTAFPKEPKPLADVTDEQKKRISGLITELQQYSEQITSSIEKGQKSKDAIDKTIEDSKKAHRTASIETKTLQELQKNLQESITALQTLQKGIEAVIQKIKDNNDPSHYQKYIEQHQALFEKQTELAQFLDVKSHEQLSKIEPQYKLKSKLNAEASALRREDKASLAKTLGQKPKKNLEDFIHIIEYLEKQAKKASLTQVPHIDFLRDCQDKCESLYLELAAFRDSKQGNLNTSEIYFIEKNLEVLSTLYAYAFNPIIHDEISKKQVYHFTDTSEVLDIEVARKKQRDVWAKDVWAKGKYIAPGSAARIDSSPAGSEKKDTQYLSKDHLHDRLSEGKAEFSTITATDKSSKTKAYFSSISTLKGGVRQTELAAVFPPNLDLNRVRSLLHPLSSIPSDIATKWAVATIGTEVQGAASPSINIELIGDYRGLYGKHAEQFLEAAYLYAAYLQKYENKKIYLFNYSGVPAPYISPNDPRIDVLASHMAKNKEIYGLQSDITASLHGKTVKHYEKKSIAPEVEGFKEDIKMPEQYRSGSKARPEGESTPTPAETPKPADSTTGSILEEMPAAAKQSAAPTPADASKGTFAIMPPNTPPAPMPPTTTPAATNSVPPIAPPRPPATTPAAKQPIAPAAKNSVPPATTHGPTIAAPKPTPTPATTPAKKKETPTEMRDMSPKPTETTPTETTPTDRTTTPRRFT